jgi:hypothetical protein
MKALIGGIAIALVAWTPAFAQKPPATPTAPATQKPPVTQKPGIRRAKPPKDRGFLSLNIGAQLVSDSLVDRFSYPVNVETATTDARYKAPASLLFDAGVGMHVWKKKVGVSVAASHSTRASTADTDSAIPHPFFDGQDREVAGEAQDLTRAETAVHVDLYFVKTSGKWRLLFSAGPTYFNVEQEVITAVTVTESYPYDTAEFRGATSSRARDSAVGFNLGADVGWRLRRSMDAGMLVRYARGTMSFNVADTHDVSSNAGGLQVAAGIRIRF